MASIKRFFIVFFTLFHLRVILKGLSKQDLVLKKFEFDPLSMRSLPGPGEYKLS